MCKAILQTEYLAGTVEIIAHNLLRISISSEQEEKQIESSLPSVEFYDCDSPLGWGWEGGGGDLVGSYLDTVNMWAYRAQCYRSFWGKGVLAIGLLKKNIINVNHLIF